MIARALIYGIAVTCNCIFTSGVLLSPSSDSRVFKEPRNDYGYLLKRVFENNSEDPDSKERRSGMGSSFIRFGRSNSLEKFDNIEQPMDFPRADSKTERQTRTRPDIIIRFGRSGHKAIQSYDRPGRGDLKFIRFGRHVLPSNLDLAWICSDIPMDGEAYGKGVRFPSTRLARLCNDLGLPSDRFEYMSDDQADSKRE